MSSMNVTVTVRNLFNQTTISQLWGVHSTSNKFTNPNWLCAQNLAPNSSATAGTVTVVSHTEDWWCFTWTDSNGDLWSTGFFESTLYMNDGNKADVQLQHNGTVDIVQGSHDEPEKPYYQVGNCTTATS